MDWRKEYLDAVLVPSGLLIMLGYHLFLLCRCLKHPETTVIGYENHNRRVWVERMMQVDYKDRGLALTVIGCDISAANYLSSISLGLSSIIGTWVGSSSHNIFTSSLVYGNTNSSLICVKYISLVACFLVAFASFIESARCLVHANLLVSMPNTDISVEDVQKTMIRGGIFWSVGLRALYFATTLLFWIFGPIPMFLCSVIMVVILCTLDKNSTPLHQYLHVIRNHNLLEKFGEEISAVARVIARRESHGNGSKTF